MYLVIVTIFIGVVIGAFTNALAIKMLFRPLKPWAIGNWQIPFTPGLIPKRRSELAEQLGQMVENYLFTAQGMKQFIEKSKLKEQIYIRLIAKLEGYQNQYETMGEGFKVIFKEDWQTAVANFAEKKIIDTMNNKNLREKNLEDILSDQTIMAIEREIEFIPGVLVARVKDYLHSIEGKRWLDSMMNHLIEGKRMIGFLAGVLMEGSHLQQKLANYLEQILNHPKTEEILYKSIIKEWDRIKKEPLGQLISNYDSLISSEVNFLVTKGLEYIEDLPIKKVVEFLEENNLIEKGYDLFLNFLLERMDKFFGFLSIAQVVTEEVNRFSLEALEKMIIEVAGRELKMITYFGGVLGGLIGLFQGMLYLFF